MANHGDLGSGSQARALQCPQCGSNRVSTSLEPHAFTYGRGPDAVQLTATVPVQTCINCGFIFLDETAEDLRHEAVCRHLRVMTPLEVAAIRKKYRLPRSEFAKVTKIGEASLARWEAGSLVQSAAYDQFLYLMGFPDNIGRLFKRGAIEDQQHHFSQSPQQRVVIRNQVHSFRMINELTDDLIAQKESFQLRPGKEEAA